MNLDEQLAAQKAKGFDPDKLREKHKKRKRVRRKKKASGARACPVCKEIKARTGEKPANGCVECRRKSEAKIFAKLEEVRYTPMPESKIRPEFLEVMDEARAKWGQEAFHKQILFYKGQPSTFYSGKLPGVKVEKIVEETEDEYVIAEKKEQGRWDPRSTCTTSRSRKIQRYKRSNHTSV